MIGIVIPLKAKRMSADWRLTEQLVKQTLYSVVRQTNQGLRVVVVCHDAPEFR